MFSRALILDLFSILILVLACSIGWFDIPATLFYIGAEVIVCSLSIAVLYGVTKRAERIANIIPVTAFIAIIVFFCASIPAVMTDTYNTEGLKIIHCIPDYVEDMFVVTWPLILIRLVFSIIQVLSKKKDKKETESELFQNMIVSLFTSIGIGLICITFFKISPGAKTELVLVFLITARLLAFIYLNKTEIKSLKTKKPR